MRSSKSRSRSKSNRNRSMGNIVNRVFDSSGPEGKVRGTPQQIIDKYNQLARDAQLANDRVATENFQQHAEHYTRLLGEAMREQEARREQQEQQHQQNQPHQQNNDRRDQGQGDQRQDRDDGGRGGRQDQPQGGGSDVVMESGNDDSGLVETPENAAPKPRRQRRKKPDAEQSAEGSGAPEAAE